MDNFDEPLKSNRSSYNAIVFERLIKLAKSQVCLLSGLGLTEIQKTI